MLLLTARVLDFLLTYEQPSDEFFLLFTLERYIKELNKLSTMTGLYILL